MSSDLFYVCPIFLALKRTDPLNVFANRVSALASILGLSSVLYSQYDQIGSLMVAGLVEGCGDRAFAFWLFG